MYKLLRIALFAAPLAGGAAWAQGSGTSGSAGAPGSAVPPQVTDDTRTPMQQKAGRLDDNTSPVVPGDATKPMPAPDRVEEGQQGKQLPDSSGMTAPPEKGPSDKTLEQPGAEPAPSDTNKPPSDTSKMENKLDSDTSKDQLDSDK
jgi:hypothetical protein